MQKTYYDLMSEITPDRLYHGLLVHGLFCDKLPPFLTAVSFFDFCQAHNKNMDSRPSKFIYYKAMREINIPRQFGIPNPISYHNLCASIRDNWYEILKHFGNQTQGHTHKISRLHIRRLQRTPALFEMNYKNWRIDGSPEPDMAIGKKYMVIADISNCFPSIYTHAISWALVGKPQAKIDRDKKKWFNIIDYKTSNLRNGETHGLLIGPHTSNLLSEIILTAIDNNLYKKYPHYMRVIDDYTCYLETYETAQRFITDLSEELRSYDLLLNYKKTKILELPIANAEQWVRQLNALEKRTESNTNLWTYKDVCAYWDNVLEIMYKNDKKSSILNYAMKVLSNKQLSENAKDYCVKNLLHYAYVFPYLIRLLDEYVFNTYNANSELISSFSNMIYKSGKEVNNCEEMSFAFFLAIKYKFKLDTEIKDEILKRNDWILSTLAYLYFKKNSLDCKEFEDKAEEIYKSKDDFGEYWLFVFEVLPKAMLKDEWKRMKEFGVSFIKDFDSW